MGKRRTRIRRNKRRARFSSSFEALEQRNLFSTDLVHVTLEVNEQVAGHLQPDDYVVFQNSADRVLTVLDNDQFLADYSGPGKITSVSYGSQGGQLQIVANGAGIRYSVPADFAGRESFVYVVDDQFSAAVTIDIRSPLEDDMIQVEDEVSSSVLNVLDNDPFWENYEGPKRITAISGSGLTSAVAIGDDGQTINYAPPSDLTLRLATGGRIGIPVNNGFVKDQLSYVVDDKYMAHVQVSIPLGVAPEMDGVELMQNDPMTVVDVLPNDLVRPNYDGPVLITGVSETSRGGEVSISEDGKSVLYTPPRDYPRSGRSSDGFHYVVDGVYEGYVGVYLRTPTRRDYLEVDSDGAATRIDVLRNDIKPATTLTAVSATKNGGQVEIRGKSVYYTPPAGFVGHDEFTYTANDQFTAKVTVQVSRVVRHDSEKVSQESSDNELFLLNNDFRSGNYAEHRITFVDETSNGGTVTIAADGHSVYYTPAPDATESETFNYWVDDQYEATVHVSLKSRTNSDGYRFYAPPSESTITLDVLQNDELGTDYAAAGKITSVEQPAAGHVTISDDGTQLSLEFGEAQYYAFNYTVDDRYSSRVSLSYVGYISSYKSVTLLRQNDPTTEIHVVTDVQASTGYANQYRGPELITKAEQAQSGGAVTISADKKTLFYTPPENYYGKDSITYYVDGIYKATARIDVIRRIRDDVVFVEASSGVNRLDVQINDMLGADYRGTGTITAVSDGEFGGQLTIDVASNTILYTPAENFQGTETFGYTVDELWYATVEVHVGDANDGLGQPPSYKDYLIEQALQNYEPVFGLERHLSTGLYGIQDSPVIYISDDNDADTISTAGSASYNSLNHSETNVQVAGVDEGDIVETDGHYLYILRGNELLIASSWPADEMSVLSRTALRGQVVAEFLAGDRLTVISEDRVDTHPAVALELDDNVDRDSGADDSLSGLVLFDVSIGDSYSRKEYVTRIRVFDVSDRSAPVMVQDNVVDGNFKDSRAIGDFAYITVDNPSYGYQLPSPKSACTESDDGATRTCISQSKEEYLSWVRESYNEIMAERLPQVRSYDSEGQLVSSGALHDADDLIAFHPDERGELVSLISINMQSDQAGIVSDAGLVATSDSQLYASLGNLYILETAVEYEDGKQTRVTQFNLTAESGEITLAARGAVAGEMVNQFSVDEYQGHLRIATIVTNAGSGNWTNRSENLMWVLKNDNGVLEHVGSVKNLALDQEIKSVRYLADNAFVVTFRDHDPLYALDMSDPVKPVAVGHIAMPGFSSYMQLIDNDRILGVGRNSVNGNDGPLQISLFDVSDLANPKAVDNFTFPHFSSSETEGDHHAFGWFANHNLLAIPTQRTISERVDNNGDGFRETTQSTVFNELAIFRVDSYRGLELVGSVEQDSPLRRTVNVEDKLYAVATDSVKTVDVRSPNQPLDELRLEAPPSEENPEDGNTSEVDPAGGIPATGNPAVGEQNLKSNDGNIAARVWHNEVVSTDVNADGTTSAQDVLVLFNLINDGIYGEMSGVATKAESRLTTGQHYPDVNSDGRLNTADVLYLINRISEKTSSQNTVVASESQTSNKQASYEDVHADPLVEQVESKIEMPATDPDPAAVDKAMDELMGPLQEDQFEELDVNFAGV